MFRLTFYNIPFSETGEEYPLFSGSSAGTMYSDLSDYTISEITTTAPIREGQNTITVTANAEILISANYARVGTVSGPTAADDTNVGFYWVRDVELLGAPSGEARPAVVSIYPDDMAEFFIASGKAEGRLAQSTVKPYSWVERDPVVAPTFQNVNRTLKKGASSECVVIASYVTQYGTFMMRGLYSIPPSQTIAQTVELFSSSTINRQYASSGTSSDTNISIQAIYVIPKRWIPAQYMPQQAGTYVQNLVTSGGYEFTPSIVAPTDETLPPILTTETLLNADECNPSDIAYIQTPGRIVKIKRDPSLGVDVTISLYVSSGTYEIDIVAEIDGEYIDVTADYTAAFSVNEEAARQSQNKTMYAIQQVSSVIGAVGGVVGGIASKNYFGAIQSVAGGAQAIMEPMVAKRQPADVKTSGGVITQILKINGIAAIVLSDQSANTPAQSSLTALYGFLLPQTPYYSLTQPTAGSYFRFASCKVTGLEGGGQDAQTSIEQRFLSGIRFVAL